ncbi:MAG: ABC transporter ATP-binding protein [Deltaproteobacteria bacterium]|nr:ABC transporter ATP-binding protein [Deltaproteobacteria bacterium]
MSHLISLKDVLVKKDKRMILALDDLVIQEGSSCAIVGPNGAGKTTLLMCLSCLEKMNAGSIFWRGKLVGRDISKHDFRRKISVVFQQALLFNMTVFDNVAYGLKLRNCSRKEIAGRVMRSLEYFGITDLAKRSARAISGGEAQRVTLARALALEPEILFLDEPFSSLDAPTSEKIILELKETIRRTGTTILLVTHNKLEALNLTRDIIVLESGKKVQAGDIAHVFQHPATEFIALFSGIDSVLSGTVVESRDGMVGVKIADRVVMAVGDFAVGCYVLAFIRPENISLSLDAISASSAKNNFPATVLDCIPVDYYHKVVVNCGFSINSIVANPTVAQLQLKTGKQVFISFKATAVHLVST